MFLSLWQLKTSVLILNYLCYIFWFHCSQNIHCISLRKSSLLSGLFMSPGNKFVIVSQYIGFQISGSRGLGFESSLRLDSPPVTFKIEYFMGKKWLPLDHVSFVSSDSKSQSKHTSVEWEHHFIPGRKNCPWTG